MHTTGKSNQVAGCPALLMDQVRIIDEETGAAELVVVVVKRHDRRWE